MKNAGFSLIELLVAAAVIAILAAMAIPASMKVIQNSSLAISANNLRQLGAGAVNYLADHQYRYWPYLKNTPNSQDVTWWFGFESGESRGRAEGKREFDAERGPLGGYVPAGLRPDSSFNLSGKAFKPKYKNGYLGIGYNVLLGGGWTDTGDAYLQNYWALVDPAKVVVFATSAQVYPFQSMPVIEEFYGIDHREFTVHFRHHGNAMVAFANGAVGFLPMDETTRDMRAPEANVGRFAPKGNKKYLE